MSCAASPVPAPLPLNAEIAARLDQVAHLLDAQGAGAFRISAYRNAAASLRALPVAVDRIYHEQGVGGLERIPGVGTSIARAIRDQVLTGRLPLLERLRGTLDPVGAFRSLPGVGPVLAERLHEELGLGTLEDLEIAVHNGRLAALPGFGEKRLAGLRAALVQRFGHGRREPAAVSPEPPVEEILDVDREYRERAEAGTLPTIAPRRLNPTHEAWLPILHTVRGERHYTALYSNTARAHRLGRTRDWVVLYWDGGAEEHQCTVVTARSGALRGHRVIRGREAECLACYHLFRPELELAAAAS
jgi:DNA polymerase (family X)